MKGLYTIILLMMSNAFMTVAWYGHLKLKTMSRFENISILAVILLSWGIAFFEYTLQVPANRIGFRETGGPFSLVELKVIQEVISIMVFTVFTLIVFRTEQFRMNHLIGFAFLILAVYFIFKK
ncbi:MAG TPA: DMT family protein [Bacteroidales bacterium]|nr:DMT family protein [Bacteroidales bacterium]